MSCLRSCRLVVFVPVVRGMHHKKGISEGMLMENVMNAFLMLRMLLGNVKNAVVECYECIPNVKNATGNVKNAVREC